MERGGFHLTQSALSDGVRAHTHKHTLLYIQIKAAATYVHIHMHMHMLAEAKEARFLEWTKVNLHVYQSH